MTRLVLPLVILLMCRAVPVAAGEPRPNVLFIAIDDLNDWVSCLGGHPQAFTPNIDRLAKRGILFTNAHCASPACNPSRAAVFSGMMPWKTGIWSNKSKRLFQQNPGMRVLPRAFRKSGYVTLGTGKLMHSSSAANRVMFDHHFDVEQRWSPFTGEAVRYTAEELPSKASENPRHVVSAKGSDPVVLPLNRMPSDRNPNNAGGESFDWGPLDVPDSTMGDTRITDWAIQRLKSKFDQPFFLGVGYYRPHIPLWAPKRYFKRFEGQDIQLPPYRKNDLDDLGETGKRWAREALTAGLHSTVLKHGEWEEAVKAYLACTTYVDAQIGRLLDAFDQGQYADNTIIVLWSDHGWHLGEKEHWGKWTGWERSTRVPLIIVPPKQSVARFKKLGRRCDEPVSLIDLYPTLAELCKVQALDSLDGQSLVSLLRDPDRQTERVVLTSFDPSNLSLRSDRWRYIRYDDGSEELYDLTVDPNEWTNVAGELESESVIQRFRREIPTAAMKQAEQAEFERLRGRVRRFKAHDVFDNSQPILFRCNFASEGFDLWSISEDDHYAIAKESPARLAIVDAPASKSGEKAARFVVRHSGGSFRSELSLPHEKGFQERWYSARIYIPDDWEHDPKSGTDIVMQWHAIPGNWQATYPNMSLAIQNGDWYLRRSYGSPQKGPDREKVRIAPVKKGTWVRWIIQAKWSPEEDGRIRVWKDGSLVADPRGANAYSTIGVDYTPYLKTGIYHPTWKAQPGSLAKVSPSAPTAATKRTVYVTDVVVADERANFESVSTVFSSKRANKSGP